MHVVYWHVPVHRWFRQFFAFQAGKQVFQSRVVLFGLSIAPQVATAFVDKVLNALFYLVDCLLMLPFQLKEKSKLRVVRETVELMGFAFKIPKLIPCTSTASRLA